MAWMTELSPGDVITFSGVGFGRVMIAVTAGGQRGSKIKVHADTHISIEKNGCPPAGATQEGFGPTLNSEGLSDGQNHHRA
ncbi:hypothetical protein [Solidesulfovibrio sp.]